MFLGRQVIKFDNQPVIVSGASIVGPKEGEGILRDYFDLILDDALWNERNWEKAESKILREAIKKAIDKIDRNKRDEIRYIFAGDLLNQLVSSTFAIREFNRAFFGLYGACSTMGESLLMASMCVDGGYSNYCVAATSSHYCTAEKQFRFPLEYGAQKKEFSSITITGGGAVVIAKEGDGPKITYGIPGKIIDYGIKDAINMGAAMAPAAADTIKMFFEDTGLSPDYFDRIITGDLGKYGGKLLVELLSSKNIEIESKYFDCGAIIYNECSKDTKAGGSGCGCSAVTLSGYVLDQLRKKEWNRVLFLPTGALLSPITINEGESIPCIAQGVVIENI